MTSTNNTGSSELNSLTLEFAQILESIKCEEVCDYIPTDENQTPDCAVLFCAHPDDEAIGAGGTLAKYAKEGKKTVVVIFTDGESSHPWKKKHILTQDRRAEAIRSAKVLGIHTVYHLKLKDGSLIKEIVEKDVSMMLQAILHKHKPRKIFTHSPDDGLYPDHIAVNKVSMDAIQKYELATAQTPNVYTFNIWTFNIRGRNSPKLFVDITDEFEQKKQALRCFKTQYLALLQLWPTVYFKAIINGIRKNVKYAEVFFRVR